MIRDGFKDEKQVTGKEARKIALMGERNYYAKQAGKLRDINKAVSFTNKFSLVIFALTYALIVLFFVLSRKTETPYETWKFALWSSLFGLMVVWVVLWETVIKRRNEKKADRYTKELERLSLQNLSKVGNAYKLYGKEYIEKVKRETENKLNEQKELAKAKENSADTAKDIENN